MNVQSLFLCYPQVHCQYFMSIVREQRTWQHFLSCHSQIHVTAVVYKDAFNTHFFFQFFPIQDLQVMWVKRLSSYLFSLKSFLPSLSLGHQVFQERKSEREGSLTRRMEEDKLNEQQQLERQKAAASKEDNYFYVLCMMAFPLRAGGPNLSEECVFRCWRMS